MTILTGTVWKSRRLMQLHRLDGASLAYLLGDIDIGGFLIQIQAIRTEIW